MLRRLSILAAALAALGGGCAPKEPPVAAVAAASGEGPNANASRYGPHGVTQVPAGQAAPTPAAPPLDPAHLDMAGHPCSCGGSCHCGHCAGMIAGCHCKPKRADGK
ncbi:MAG: hypothetical protein ACYDCL_13025 [Myxococcales bacterium]